MNKWLNIRTAPKDREVLCYDFDWSETGVVIAEYYGESDGSHWWQVAGRDDDTTHFKPTHWMPLPNPPSK